MPKSVEKSVAILPWERPSLASRAMTSSDAPASASFVFYESLLPHIASEEEVDRVSTAGYAFGYVGGGVLLAVNLAWIQKPELFGMPAGTFPVRLSFVSVAIWWLLFSIPLFRGVREPPRAIEPDEKPTANPARMAFVRLGETFRELRGYKNAFLFLVAFLLYNDGIATIQKITLTDFLKPGFSRVMNGATKNDAPIHVAEIQSNDNCTCHPRVMVTGKRSRRS